MLDPVAYINEPRWHSMDLGLDRTYELLARLGNPQDSLHFVHVAGTNGKGSACAFTARILQEAGYKVGLFTSPYLIRFEERIRVDGQDISADDLYAVTCQVREAAEQMASHPTEFELMTAVAFLHFARSGCDIVVAEVGLGGRLDSTNVITTVEASVIMPIALDHCAFLGDTIPQIATEKAGIIKPGTPVVSAPQDPAALDVIAHRAVEQQSALTVCDASAISGANDDFSYREWNDLRLSLQGHYQLANAATVLELVGVLRERGWRITDDAVRAGLATTSWPGRFEVVADAPAIIVDGAHNPQGAAALADELGRRYAGKRIVFAMGVLSDKDYPAMLASLVPSAAAFVCLTPPNPRALSAQDLAAAVGEACETCGHALERPAIVATSIDEAVDRARALAGPDDVCVLCGSLYSIGAIKEALARR